jgi:hypothetical protein
MPASTGTDAISGAIPPTLACRSQAATASAEPKRSDRSGEDDDGSRDLIR